MKEPFFHEHSSSTKHSGVMRGVCVVLSIQPETYMKKVICLTDQENNPLPTLSLYFWWCWEVAYIEWPTDDLHRWLGGLCKCTGGFVVWTDTAGGCPAAKSFWKVFWRQEQCHVGIPQVSASTLSKDLGLELLPVFSLRNSKNQEWNKRRWRKGPSFTGQPAEGKQRQIWGTSMWM